MKNQIIKELEENVEFLETSDGDEVESVSLENAIGCITRNSIDTSLLSRIEIIGSKGREIVTYGSYQFDIQDEGRTLKIFRNENT